MSGPKLVIAGASGFVGSTLTEAAIAAGYAVTRLLRSRPEQVMPGVTDVVWNPSEGELDETVLVGARGVVCLNGASLFGWLWTREYKQTLWNSRIDSVRTIVDAIARLDKDARPDAFVSGSAIGYYGPDSRDAVLDEGAHAGVGFLADLCIAWEKEADRARELGVRTVNLRTGLVMGADGGMLGILHHLYRLGLGGQLGDGQAWMSTISVVDHVRAILFALKTSIDGPMNATCPEPIRNADWNDLLATHLSASPLAKLSGFIRIPAPLLRLVLRDMAREAVLASQRAVPSALVDHGFTFTAPTPSAIFDQVLSQRS